MIQCGVRGIYVGFPIGHAGYLIWIPSARQFDVCVDVASDEDISSTLGQPILPTIPSVLWPGLVLLL